MTPNDPQAVTVFRFVVAIIPDRTGVSVFTPAMIGPDKINQALKTAAAKSPGAVVQAAGPVMPVVEDTGAEVRYTYGTGGAVRFSGPQPDKILSQLQSAIADELIKCGFGIFE